jgi:hypothetical protein
MAAIPWVWPLLGVPAVYQYRRILRKDMAVEQRADLAVSNEVGNPRL